MAIYKVLKPYYRSGKSMNGKTTSIRYMVGDMIEPTPYEIKAHSDVFRLYTDDAVEATAEVVESTNDEVDYTELNNIVKNIKKTILKDENNYEEEDLNKLKGLIGKQPKKQEKVDALISRINELVKNMVEGE